MVLAAGAALSGTWVPVVCAALAAGATMGAAWLGNRRIRAGREASASVIPQRERELEERLFMALKANEDLHAMVVQGNASLVSERRLNRQLRRQLREAKSA